MAEKYKIVIYQDEYGESPFERWLYKKIKDSKTQSRILARIERVRHRNLGDYKKLTNAEGIFELRLDFGSGYRVYFAFDEGEIVVILMGGDKSGQNRDIAKSALCWKDYLRRKYEK